MRRSILDFGFEHLGSRIFGNAYFSLLYYIMMTFIRFYRVLSSSPRERFLGHWVT